MRISSFKARGPKGIVEIIMLLPRAQAARVRHQAAHVLSHGLTFARRRGVDGALARPETITSKFADVATPCHRGARIQTSIVAKYGAKREKRLLFLT